MKKLTVLLILLTVALMACGGGKSAKKAAAKQPETVKVLDSSGPMPAWVEMGEEVGKYQGNKVIFFTGYGTSKSRDTARQAAGLNATASAAAAMKALATKQVARSWESIGTGDAEQKEQVMKGLEAISAKNVDASGLIQTAVWWRHVMRPKYGDGGKVIGWSQPVYEYYYRYALDYDTYVKRRDEVIQQVTKESPEKKEEQTAEEEPEKQEQTAQTENKEEEKKEEENKTIRFNANFNNTLDEVDEE
jgi:hypothetical protein